MASTNFSSALQGINEIEITVTGRTSGSPWIVTRSYYPKYDVAVEVPLGGSLSPQ